MSLSLRFCVVLILLSPPLARSAVLENPIQGSLYSGIGVISGWKCEADGPLTVRFDGGAPIPLAYPNERTDTARVCGDTNNGFVSIFNWAILGDGVHTAIAYDNGVEFAQSTFEIATLGEEFATVAAGECRVVDFPALGETTLLEWNQATQHFEIGIEDAPPPDSPAPPVFSDFELGRCSSGAGVQICVRDNGCEDGDRVKVEVNGREEYVGPIFWEDTCFIADPGGVHTRIDLTALNEGSGDCYGTPEPPNAGIMSITGSRYGEPPVLRQWDLAAGQTASMIMRLAKPIADKCQPLGETNVTTIQPLSPGEWGHCNFACRDPVYGETTGSGFWCTKQEDCTAEFLEARRRGCSHRTDYTEIVFLQWEDADPFGGCLRCAEEDALTHFCVGVTRTTSRWPRLTITSQ